MGTDIHGGVEYYQRWNNPANGSPAGHPFTHAIYYGWRRNYQLFALLAGVRDSALDTTGYEPLFEPRGFREIPGWRDEMAQQGDGWGGYESDIYQHGYQMMQAIRDWSGAVITTTPDPSDPTKTIRQRVYDEEGKVVQRKPSGEIADPPHDLSWLTLPELRQVADTYAQIINWESSYQTTPESGLQPSTDMVRLVNKHNRQPMIEVRIGTREINGRHAMLDDIIQTMEMLVTHQCDGREEDCWLTFWFDS